MQHMGWSWTDLMDAPVALVDAIVETLAADQHWTKVKSSLEKR